MCIYIIYIIIMCIYLHPPTVFLFLAFTNDQEFLFRTKIIVNKNLLN